MVVLRLAVVADVVLGNFVVFGLPGSLPLLLASCPRRGLERCGAAVERCYPGKGRISLLVDLHA
eukprot:1858839-Pyramimonas_sp.AAC.2